MKDAYLLQHVHYHENLDEDVKIIGIYESEEVAKRAIERVKEQSGFCDFPNLIDPGESDYESGFTIDRYEVNQDHWQDGFVTC